MTLLCCLYKSCSCCILGCNVGTCPGATRSHPYLNCHTHGASSLSCPGSKFASSSSIILFSCKSRDRMLTLFFLNSPWKTGFGGIFASSSFLDDWVLLLLDGSIKRGLGCGSVGRLCPFKVMEEYLLPCFLAVTVVSLPPFIILIVVGFQIRAKGYVELAPGNKATQILPQCLPSSSSARSNSTS